MSYTIKINIFVKPQKWFDIAKKKFDLGKVIDALLKINASIDLKFGRAISSFTPYRDVTGSLEEIKEIILREGGSIPFVYSGLYFDLMYLLPSHSHYPLPFINVTCDRASLRNNLKNVNNFIAVSKCIWNALG